MSESTAQPAFGVFDVLAEHEHEQVSYGSDLAAGYRGIIAIHDTRLGPALGGSRCWTYGSERDALIDVLRLARAMTYKAAVADLDVGGGKSVVLLGSAVPAVGAKGVATGGAPRALGGPTREALFRAHGRHIERLCGRYITTEDVGTAPADMAAVRRETQHAVGVPDLSGDPSPVTAFGVYRGIQACLRHLVGRDDVAGKTVAVQGAGHVGYHLARLVQEGGGRVVVTDLDPARARRVVEECGARSVGPEEIYEVTADVFAPCALGAVIDDRTLPRLRVAIVAGGANNQLAEDRHGDALEARGILYAPDYVINAGGLISVHAELRGLTAAGARRKTMGIYDSVLRVFRLAREAGIPAHQAADRLAREHLARAGSARETIG